MSLAFGNAVKFASGLALAMFVVISSGAPAFADEEPLRPGGGEAAPIEAQSTTPAETAAPAPAPAPDVVDPLLAKVVARVNGQDITRDEMNNALAELIPRQIFHSSVPEDRLKQLKKLAVDTLINNVLIYELAIREKMDTVTKKEIDEEIENIRKRLPKGETLKKLLKRSNLTMDELKQEIKKGIVIARVQQAKRDEITKASKEIVNDEYLRKYYNDNLDKFEEPAQLLLRGILIKGDRSGGKKAWDETLVKATSVLDEIKAGADLAETAKKYSEDPFAKDGGLMGWVHAGSLLPEIEAVLANMKPGDISEPIMTIYGFHIIRVEERKAPTLRKFEELNLEKLRKELEKKEYKRLERESFVKLREGAKIEYLINF